MFFALDEQGNRVHASSKDTFVNLYCPVCGEPVKHRKGKNRRWHFAHLPDSNCLYGKDKDYNHEWHIRMQEYFPLDIREYRFVDSATKEVHIADVFLPDFNTVLEFQHSSISDEEFLSRTNFHLNEGRRMVWLFDESEKTPQPEHFGKFKRSYMGTTFPRELSPSPYYCNFVQNPYADRYFLWLRNPRKCLASLKDLEVLADRLVICVYTGLQGDCFHRLVHKKHEDDETTVTFSLHDIIMREGMDIEEFFTPEEYWQQQPPWMNRFAPFNHAKAMYEFQIETAKVEQKRREEINKSPSQPRIISTKRNFHF
ncbi:MAG: hypothetical protein IIY40_02915 [Firmicutes bacterium]|nr:hypothetical protein [Bacillota bacterium]